LTGKIFLFPYQGLWLTLNHTYPPLLVPTNEKAKIGYLVTTHSQQNKEIHPHKPGYSLG